MEGHAVYFDCECWKFGGLIVYDEVNQSPRFIGIGFFAFGQENVGFYEESEWVLRHYAEMIPFRHAYNLFQ